MRRVLLLCCAVLLAGAGNAAAADVPSFAPIDRPGPALTVAPEKLARSVTCTDDVASNPREPVLLTPATTVTSAENFSWNWIPALKAAGFAVCTSDNPDDPQNMGDMQARGQYVAYAIRRVHALAGNRRIAVIGHSQGGMIMRWALRFWPDTRAMVADVVGMAGTNHGSAIVKGALCAVPCAPALWQQAAGSHFNTALNSGQETFTGIDYTEIYSRVDEFVQPNLDDHGTSSVHGPGRITNVALQELCPADVSEHLLIGTTDAVAWALGLDALTHDGPADPARIPPSVCRQSEMPGVQGLPGPLSLTSAAGRVVQELALAPTVAREPAPACYVLAAGCSGQPTAVACPPRRVVVHVRTLPFRVTRVVVGGRVVRIRNGAVSFTVRTRAVVRFTGTDRRGRHRSAQRTYRACRG